jgi:IS30 family transposase
MKRTYSQIGIDERRKIARWRTAGISVEAIAAGEIDRTAFLAVETDDLP